MTKFTLVEHAGYEKEQDVRQFPTLSAALRHMHSYYAADELDAESPNCMHIGVRADYDNGECEYVA